MTLRPTLAEEEVILATGGNGRRVILRGVAASSWRHSYKKSESIVFGVAWRAMVTRIARRLADVDELNLSTYWIPFIDKETGEPFEEVAYVLPGQLNAVIQIEESDVVIIYVTDLVRLQSLYSRSISVH